MIGSDDIMIIDAKLSNNEHIVRTTQQWEAAAVKYKIIPNGCLCVEFTIDGKTKIKIGDGHKYYEQLPYAGGYIDIKEIIEIIEEYIDSKEFFEIQEPIIPSVDNLPLTGNDIGDVRFVINPNPTGEHDLYIPFVWFDDKWNIVGGGNVDLSNYPTKQEMNEAIGVVDARVDDLSETVNTFDGRITVVESKAHTHTNKPILDNTTASFTIGDKTKLDGIEDHANYYVLPKATSDILGGIKIGNYLNINSEGVLSVITDDDLDILSKNPVENNTLTITFNELNRRIHPVTPGMVDIWWDETDYNEGVIAGQYIDFYYGVDTETVVGDLVLE